ITAVHISTEEDDRKRLLQLWKEKVEAPAAAKDLAVPRLHILESPYRRVTQPVIDFVNSSAKQNPDRLVAVVIPERVDSRWYNFLLRRFVGTRLHAALLLKGEDSVVVVDAPWHVRAA